MDFTIKLLKITSIDKIEGAWTSEDYRNLLELFEYPDSKDIQEEELFDMLSMAISDFEPDEAAEVILKYRVGEILSEGQIQNLSHEMMEDKVSEEYPDISMHYSLFNINQLLHDAYNGKFPRTLASEIEFELDLKGEIDVTEEIVLRTMSDLLSEKSLLKRLFDEQLDSGEELKEARNIVWELDENGENNYRLITSDYWINREDFENEGFSGVLRDEEIEHLKSDRD